MKRTIKCFQDFTNIQQAVIYKLFENGELERVRFPFQNDIADGVIFNQDEIMYLIPINGITLSKHKISHEDINMPNISVEYQHKEETE